MKKISIILLLAAFFINGCKPINDIMPASLSEEDQKRLEEVEKEMFEDYTFENLVDEKILTAVKQLVKTLKPEYRGFHFGQYKLGFLEISDIDRKTVKKFHNYITEKTLTFSFLQPEIAKNFTIVERFLLGDILRELTLENLPRRQRVIDHALAKRMGKVYHLDVIETGVTTESEDFLDINLRMIETKRGRIIAVGSVKIEKTEPVRKWLKKMAEVGVGWP